MISLLAFDVRGCPSNDYRSVLSDKMTVLFLPEYDEVRVGHNAKNSLWAN
jgi:hypothetical protein